jgi:hypothetical protein
MLQTLARRSVRPSLATRVQMQRRYLDYGHDMHKVRMSHRLCVAAAAAFEAA